MATTLSEKMKTLSASRRKRIEARTREILAEEMSLSEVRKALSLTQVRLAESLGIGQEGVSRLEKRTDLLLSTLRSYVEAMGGELEIVARFPNHRPVKLSGIAGVKGSND